MKAVLSSFRCLAGELVRPSRTISIRYSRRWMMVYEQRWIILPVYRRRDRSDRLAPYVSREEVFTMPRIGLLRTIMLNHWYHHRGQLSVYLRMLEVPVPVIYGRSADENPFV